MTSRPRLATTRAVSAATVSASTRSRAAGSSGSTMVRPLGLGHHLGGDGEHVPVGQLQPGPPDRLQQQAGQVVPGADLGHPGQRHHQQGGPFTGAPPGRLQGRLGQGGRVLDGPHQRRDDQRLQAEGGHVAGLAGVDGVEHEGVGQPGVEAGHPRADTSAPQAGSSLSAMPLTGAPPTIGVTATTRQGAASTAARIPGTARMGAIDTTGLDGQIRTPLAVARASVTPGAGRASSTPWKRTARTGSRAWRPTQYSWNPRSRGPSGPSTSTRVDPLVAHWHQPHRHAEAVAQLGRGLRQGGALGQQPGPEQVGGDVAVPEGEPAGLAQPDQRLAGVPGLAGQAPARSSSASPARV